MSKQTENFAFSPPIILIEEEKWLLGVTFFESTSSILSITDENNSFSISPLFYWGILSNLEDDIIDKLKNLLELKSQNDIEIHIAEDKDRGNKIKINSKEFASSDFGSFKKEILEEIKKANYHDLEDMVCRMQITYEAFMDRLDKKIFPWKGTGFTLPKGIYEISDFNETLEKFLPKYCKSKYYYWN